ncbi:peptidoglycan recognition protein family protein [Caballeronia concitans]|uniref:N-acetylmuramoyl-L-alanine amidase n=1 Tax=Caballeronia concitans TaxID=1777133 RepID=A0A658QQU0_9BURK|nr:peptidoglycan recognition family protein [Caballeronia concitans]KIG02432.1 N-acetylmuramoyl-L-alanine amidase family 2 [Burkholderia sp. MR1]SAL11657.1 N-acetylmuramoyl-L-alanine amidase [Caballeronia concitans]
MASDYNISHWTKTRTSSESSRTSAISIAVNNRGATRQAIITALARSGYSLIERSSWHAIPPRGVLRESHWDYHDIVLHHAGRSYSCGAPSIQEMQRVQAEDMGRSPPFNDAGYHYAISCQGEIYEARDIRFTGEHVAGDNTGKIGIVFLANLVQAGEAYQQEYGRLSFIDKLRNIGGIVTDRTVLWHDEPTHAQVMACRALCSVLMEFFNVERLGGHREYQQIATHKGRACPGNLGMDIVKLLRSELSLSAPRG